MCEIKLLARNTGFILILSSLILLHFSSELCTFKLFSYLLSSVNRSTSVKGFDWSECLLTVTSPFLGYHETWCAWMSYASTVPLPCDIRLYLPFLCISDLHMIWSHQTGSKSRKKYSKLDARQKVSEISFLVRGRKGPRGIEYSSQTWWRLVNIDFFFQ
jgi:hypothetical protein